MFHFVFLKRSRLCRCKRWPNWRCNHWKTVSKYWQGKGWECLPDVQIHKRNNAMQQGFQSLQMLQTAEFVLNLATFFSERITFRGSFIWNVFESSFELENGIKNLWSHINIMFHLVTWLILNLSNEISTSFFCQLSGYADCLRLLFHLFECLNPVAISQ